MIGLRLKRVGTARFLLVTPAYLVLGFLERPNMFKQCCGEDV